MISAKNPIHRLKELEETEQRLELQLAPGYQAISLLHHGIDGSEDVDVTILEAHPKFRPLWLELQEVQKEKMKIHMNLALAWESSPVNIW